MPDNTDILTLTQKFRHKVNGVVKFHEVDAFQVVHNLQYLLWTENARVEYCKELDINILSNKISANRAGIESSGSIFLVHTDIDYYSPATFADTYCVYTRASKLGNSSLTFEHVITKLDNIDGAVVEILLCISQAVEVYVDTSNQPMRIADEIRNKIINFEKENLNS